MTFEVEDYKIEDDMDPFNQGIYELMIKILLRIVNVTIESLKNAAKGAPLNSNTWRHMKSRVMLKVETIIYLQTLPNVRVSYVT